MLRAVKVLNAVLMTAAFGAMWYLYYADYTRDPFYRRGNYVIIFLFFVIYVMGGRVYEAFLVSYNRIVEMVYSQTLAFLFADLVMFAVSVLLTKGLPWIWPYALLIGVQILIAALWSVLAHRWYFRTFPPKKTIIVFDMREGLHKVIGEYGMSKKFEVIDTMSAKECIKNMRALRKAEVVFLAGVHSKDRNRIIKYCIERNITSFIIPRVGDVLMSGARRVLLAIIILSPVMIITAIAIKRDGGPALYKQCRLTKDGKTFNVMKFRSMRVDAEKDGVARLSTGDHDDRVTPVGKVIRKVRIDELPQLFNILAGDMSIVGPRPERPEIAAQYEKEMPEFRLRLQAKAGLTGYAQVYGKYNTTPYDKLQMDLMYIAHPSFAQDLRICLATIKILFLPESTEGIAEGAVTAEEPKKHTDD